MDDIRNVNSGDPSWVNERNHRLLVENPGAVTQTGFQATGKLGAVTRTLSMAGIVIPCTVTLHSTDAGRKIEGFSDDLLEPYQLAYDAMSSSMIVVTIRAPLDRIVFTGAANDDYRVK